MPLQKLQFAAGINREGTTLSNKGGYYACDKIRFRYGQVEKIGGYTLDTGIVNTGGSYLGVGRSVKNWIGLTGNNYLGIGTNSKFYIQSGISGFIYDITPIRFTSAAGAATFVASNGSSTITVNETSHGALNGDYVIFSGAVSLGGNITAAILNNAAGYQITYINANSYSITVSAVANASDTGNGGASTIAKYQIHVGAVIYTANVGWGAGGWGGISYTGTNTGWGQAAPASQSIVNQLRLWSQSNYGQNLVFNPRGGPIYYWVPNSVSSTTYNVGQVLSATNTNVQNTTTSLATTGIGDLLTTGASSNTINLATTGASSNGIYLTTTGASSTSGITTLTFATQSSAPYTVGSTIYVSGITPIGFNGTYTVTACTTSSVSYANSTVGPQTIAGTVVNTPIIATLTFATQSSAPYAVGSVIVVSGITPAGFNGTYYVTACTTSSVSYINSTVGPQTVAGTVVNTPTTATLTFATQASAPYVVGSQITVSGVTPTGYNGNYVVTACTTSSVSYYNTTTGAQTVAGYISLTGIATLTFATQASVPFPVGSTIFVSGITPTGYNGTYTVLAATTSSVSYANSTLGPQTVAGSVYNGTQYWLTDASCPTIANFIIVSDASRFLIAFGTDTYGDGVQNPMLVSWSDQENLLVWTPTSTNQAGNYTLSKGSQIISAVQSRQEIVIFTDVAVYSMQYLGAPYFWGFNILADNISIMGPNAVVTANNITYWMGKDRFFMYSGQVQTLPCTLREYVYQDINQSQAYQCFAGINEGYNEVWWFYCSANSTVIDKYVIYNHLDNVWYYGNLTRTAWADSPLRGFPTTLSYAPATTTTQAVGLTDTIIYVTNNTNFPSTGVVEIDAERIYYTGSTSTTLTGCERGYAGTTPAVHDAGATVTDIGVIESGIVYHESGIDNGTSNPVTPISEYVQSSDFDIGDGDHFGFVWRIIPDVSFNGSNSTAPSVKFTVFPRQNPGTAYGLTNLPSVTSSQNYISQSTYEVQEFTEYAYCRIRGRQMSFVISSDGLGVKWLLGVPRLEIRQDGRR